MSGVLGLTLTIYYILDPLHQSIFDPGGRLCCMVSDRPWAGNGLVPATGGGDWQNHGFCVPRSPVHATKRLKRAGMVVRMRGVICMLFILRASVAADRVQRHRLIVIMADAFWGKVAAHSHQRSARSCIRRHTHNAFHRIVGNSDNTPVSSSNLLLQGWQDFP